MRRSDTIHEPDFEEEIASRCAAGQLCPVELRTGAPCGREIEPEFGLGLCDWHSREKMHLPQLSDGTARRGQCTTDACTNKIIYVRSRLCRACHTALLYSGKIRRKTWKARPRSGEIAQGHVVEI